MQEGEKVKKGKGEKEEACLSLFALSPFPLFPFAYEMVFCLSVSTMLIFSRVTRLSVPVTLIPSAS